MDLHVVDSDLEDRNQVGLVMDAFRATNKAAIMVVFTGGDRPGIHVAVTDDLIAKGVQAGDIAKAFATATGGKGGGRPHFASAGVGNPTLLANAREQAGNIVRSVVKT